MLNIIMVYENQKFCAGGETETEAVECFNYVFNKQLERNGDSALQCNKLVDIAQVAQDIEADLRFWYA